MFWGLIMEPKRRYSQVVKKRFHVSMAALDIFTANEDPAQLLLYFQERNYLLCTLQKNQTLQCALDLVFEEGDQVVFATNGDANIHLSGYLIDDEEEEELEESLDGSNVFEESDVGSTRSKRRKETVTQSPQPKKKSRMEQLLDDVDSYNSADDMNYSDVMAEEGDEESDDDDDDDADEDEVEEEEEMSVLVGDGEEDDEEDESAEDEEEDDEEEESSLSEEEADIQKPKVNGVSPKRQPAPAKKQKGKDATKQQSATPNNKAAKTPDKKPTPKAEKATKPTAAQPAKGGKKQIEGGVIIEDLQVGSGRVAGAGRPVVVQYQGRFKSNNKLFDKSTDKGFKFRLGRQEVIKGWDVGVVGMKVGGKRRIICPPNMAYGAKGAPPSIPPNSTLVFEVELKSVS